jgi:hypothetical protein
MRSKIRIVTPTGGVPLAIVKPTSPALRSLKRQLDPSVMVFALSALSNDDLAALAQALIAALPVQTGDAAPVPPGLPFVNSSGYLVFAQ